MHINLSQLILYRDFVVWITTQNVFKMLPQKISPLSKSDTEILQITTEAVLFKLYLWLCIFIHHINLLVKLWQGSSEWCKILDLIHHRTSLQLHQKHLGQPLIKWLMISQLSVHKYPILLSFYFQNTFIYVFNTRSCISSEHIW